MFGGNGLFEYSFSAFYGINLFSIYQDLFSRLFGSEFNISHSRIKLYMGDLSAVDETTEHDKILRDNFYIKNGYIFLAEK